MIRTMSFLLCLVEMVHQCTGFEAVVIQEYSLSPSFWTLLVSDSDLPDISETIRQGVFDGRADIDIQSYKTTEYVRVEVTVYDPAVMVEVEEAASNINVEEADALLQSLLPPTVQGILRVEDVSEPVTTIVEALSPSPPSLPAPPWPPPPQTPIFPTQMCSLTAEQAVRRCSSEFNWSAPPSSGPMEAVLYCKT